jgi:protein-S-isoprenylcysteine O-methyltransferase Ste14
MFESFEEFLTMSRTQIPVIWFIVNLLLTGVLAVIVSQIYVRYGTSLSNRRLFARNFMLISMTTMLIITIVKSSLALSLGLVGALSIVRFRAAIKEPEELAYLFICIAIGLGFGAN